MAQRRPCPVSRGLAVQAGFVPSHGGGISAVQSARRIVSQCEILVDAYDDVRIGGRPKGQATINAPLLHALEQVLKFTTPPAALVGLNNLRLDEYPVAALREALVNVAHRTYDDRARKPSCACTATGWIANPG